MPKHNRNESTALKWTDEMTLKLVLHVEDREELWNTRSSSYKRGDKRGFMDISRNETGSEIHAAEYERKWNAIREKYRKTLKAVKVKNGASGSGCGPDYQYDVTSPAKTPTSKTVKNWPLWKHLHFLAPVLKERQTVSSFSQEEYEDVEFLENVDSNSNPNHTPNKTPAISVQLYISPQSAGSKHQRSARRRINSTQGNSPPLTNDQMTTQSIRRRLWESDERNSPSHNRRPVSPFRISNKPTTSRAKPPRKNCDVIFNQMCGNINNLVNGMRNPQQQEKTGKDDPIDRHFGGIVQQLLSRLDGSTKVNFMEKILQVYQLLENH